MSDNFQNPSLLGAANSLQLSLPVVSDATSLTGNVCNLSTVSTPAFTSAWPLLSTPGTSFQPLTGSAYLCQHSSSPMLSGVTGQNHISTSATSCPSTLKWEYIGHNKKKSPEHGDFTVTLVDQGTSVPSITMTSQYADANAIAPLYPSLSASLVQGTLSQIPHQENSLLLPHQQRNHVYYYQQNTAGPLLSEEPGLCLQSYGSVSYTGSGVFAPQPDIVMMLQEVQPTTVLPPVSTSGIYDSVSAQPNTEINFQELEESNVSTTTHIKDTETIHDILLQENSMITKYSIGQDQRNKHEALENVNGIPEAKVQCPNPECLLKEEVIVCTVPASDKASMNTAKPSTRKTPKAASSRVSKTKSHAQKETKRIRENNTKKCEETKQSGDKIKTEEKTSTPKMKHKRNHPELNPENFKRPRTNLGVQMWESVQVFHALGKKNEKKKELSSPKTLRNASSTQDTKFTPARKSWLHIPHEGRGPKNIPVKKRDRSESQYPSPSQDELPPPGKVKLVPLPFLTPEKPQARPISRRLQSLASRRPTVPYPARPCSNTAQPPAVSLSQPATTNTNSIGSTKTSQPIATNTNTKGLNNTPQLKESQAAVARPEPYKTSSSTSLQHKLAGYKLQSMPKPQNQYLLEDFSRQPIPWRKPDIPGPVVSNPITKEQRPEREAMKRQAQQEREKAAQYTALGKLQFFVQRQKDMEVSKYYGYAM